MADISGTATPGMTAGSVASDPLAAGILPATPDGTVRQLHPATASGYGYGSGDGYGYGDGDGDG